MKLFKRPSAFLLGPVVVVTLLLHVLVGWLFFKYRSHFPMIGNPSPLLWVHVTSKPEEAFPKELAVPSLSRPASSLSSVPPKTTPHRRVNTRPLRENPAASTPAGGESTGPLVKQPSVGVGIEKSTNSSSAGNTPNTPPIDLFNKAALNKAIGAVGSGTGPIPTRPDPLLSSVVPPVEKKEVSLEPEKGGGYRHTGQNIVAHIKPDCSVSFEDRFPVGFQKGGTFTFDITDLAEKGRGKDPYAWEKRKFMDATAGFRKKRCEEVLEERSRQAKELLESKMSQVLQRGNLAEQRRELFEMWMDIGDEAGPSVASKLRQQWMSFVRHHFPIESSKAYTAEELTHFEEKRRAEGLHIPFHPYPKELSASEKESMKPQEQDK